MPRKRKASSRARTKAKRTRSAPYTAKHQRFVEEYLLDYNAQQAALRAGYSKKDTAGGYRLIRLPRIQAQIRARLKEFFHRIEVTADDIRQGFVQIAFDARDEVRGGPTRVERMMALDRLAKMFGMYKVDRPGVLGRSLEDLLNDAGGIESALGPAMPPPRLRLIDGGRS